MDFLFKENLKLYILQNDAVLRLLLIYLDWKLYTIFIFI